MNLKRSFFLFFKRSVAYTVNKIIYLIPAYIIANVLFFSLFDAYRSLELYERKTDDGLVGFVIFFMGVFIISPLFATITALGGPFWEDPTLSSIFLLLALSLTLTMLEFISILIFRRDIGSKIFKLDFCPVKDTGIYGKMKLLLRTLIKYLTLFFFPPLLLFPLFNKQRLFLHEMVSGMKKVERTR